MLYSPGPGKVSVMGRMWLILRGRPPASGVGTCILPVAAPRRFPSASSVMISIDFSCPYSAAEALSLLRDPRAVPDLVEVLRKIRPPFSVNAVAQAAAIAALADHEHRLYVRTATLEGRKRLTQMFERSGYDVVPSQANFILVLVEDEVGLGSQLLRGGVSVRPGSTLGIPGAIRVTVPSDDGFRLLEQALRTS